MFSNNQRDFIRKAIGSAQRIDGRRCDDFRNIKIAILEAGQCQAQLGKTRVCATVSCEITRPLLHRPTEGSITFATTFPNSGLQSNSQTLVEEKICCQMLEKAFRKSQAVDTEGLCIVAGLKVWTVSVDIVVLNNDGNLLDCAALAAITALLHFKRPDVTVTGTDITVHPESERVGIPLSIHHIPICTTFGFFHLESSSDAVGEPNIIHIVDPNIEEEQAITGSMNIFVNSQHEICTITCKSMLSTGKLSHCIQIATVKAEIITQIIKDALKANELVEEKSK